MRYFLFLLVTILSISCSTKFDLKGDSEERPVVYFLLDPNEEYHYLKLSKTFLGDGNAYDYAQIPDSNLFTNVVAVVKEVKGSGNNSQIEREWILTDTVLENKSPGVFYYPEQPLYYFKANDLIADNEHRYELHIDIENGKHKVFGSTSLVRDVSITSPNLTAAFIFANNNTQQDGYRNQLINFSPGTGAIFNLSILFHYNEYTNSGVEVKTVKWNVEEINREDLSGPITARGVAFYQLLSNNIQPDPDVIKRTVNGLEVVLTAGSNDLLTFMKVNQPSTSLAQNQPEFNNLEGGALGIFTSRATVRQFKVEDPTTMFRALNNHSTKELCNGIYTGTLGFCSEYPGDSGFQCD